MKTNSTEVEYGFGQLGSVFMNDAHPIFPPQGLVIVAIQFLADNIPTSMITETLDFGGPQFPGTDATEASAANYLGAAESAVASAGNTAGVVTIVANTNIKQGQFIVIGLDADTIDAGITLDTGAGHITPIYNGPNKQGLRVKSISGTTLTIENLDGSVFDASDLDGDNTLYFLDNYHGVGGTTTAGVRFPKGIVIYGRWTTVVPAADDDGGVICYFGK